MSLSERAESIRSRLERSLPLPKFRNGEDIPMYGSNWSGEISLSEGLRLTVYLRDTHYLFRESYSKLHAGTWKRALVLASIRSSQPGSGLMPDVLAALEAEAVRRGCHVVRIENFENKGLYSFCLKQGYVTEPILGRGLRSVYKSLSSLKETSPENTIAR